MAATDFLNAGSGATVLSGTTDEIYAKICSVDPGVNVMSYVVQYEQSTNPLFGT
ncbi:MAG: hypothetical protein NVSMB5_25290 [Candidatus Velthaea sp.]